jgi:hypothetical protein
MCESEYEIYLDTLEDGEDDSEGEDTPPEVMPRVSSQESGIVRPVQAEPEKSQAFGARLNTDIGQLRERGHKRKRVAPPRKAILQNAIGDTDQMSNGEPLSALHEDGTTAKTKGTRFRMSMKSRKELEKQPKQSSNILMQHIRLSS